MAETATDAKADAKPDAKPLGVSATIAAMKAGVAAAAEAQDDKKGEDEAGKAEGEKEEKAEGEETQGAEEAEETEAGAEKVEGEETDEGEEKAEGAEEGAEDALVVEIPGRRQGEEPIKLAVEDQETADRLNQLTKSGLRREQLNNAMAAIERQREELDLVEQHMELDPIGFLVERVKPDIQVDLAKHLLSIPEVFQAVSQELEEWGDENVRGRRQAELARARSDSRRGAEAAFGQIRVAKEQGRLVRNTVEAITPLDMEDEDGTLFQDDCLRDVAAWCRANPDVKRLRPEEVVTILEKRLRYHGVKPESALAALSSGQPFRRAAAARPKKGAPASGTSDLEAARTTGAKLKAGGDARRAAAAVPAGGAGARPTKLEPPPKQGVKERIQWLKKLVRKG